MAQKPAEIDLDRVERLARIGCTVAEIAAVEGYDKKTLERHAMDIINKGREHRNASLRRRQFQAAMDGNATMLIWLGKQCLGQRDNIDLSADIRQTYYISGEPTKDRKSNVIDLDPDQWALQHKPNR